MFDVLNYYLIRYIYSYLFINWFILVKNRINGYFNLTLVNPLILLLMAHFFKLLDRNDLVKYIDLYRLNIRYISTST